MNPLIQLKKAIPPSAHLLRGVFYLLLLLAVCVVPFTLAQSRSRGTAKQSAGRPTRLAPSAAASALASKSTIPETFNPSGVCDVIVNGGFETGSFPPWTISGDTSFTSVSTVMPRSGTYCEFSGPVTSDGFTDQVLPTVAGTAYNVSFWLANNDSSGNNRFGASLGSIILVPEAVQAPFGYTLYTFNNVIPGANADLHFIFYNVPGNFFLDDVCVTPSTGTPTPSPTPTPTPSGTPTCTPGPLWYNGDLNYTNGLSNEDNTELGSGEFGSVYDDFIVPSGPGWTVTSVFSDNLENTNVTGASWEIRTGVSEGNGGTLIASGMTMTPLVTPTGRIGFGFTEFIIEVTGLNVDLAPGTYWLNVTPIGNLSGRSFDSNTSGANCVGTPCGNDMNAFFNSNFFNANFENTSEQGQATDFSMGVNGTSGSGCGSPTPTPTPTPTATGSPTCTAGPLWYNGDFNHVNSLSNEENTELGSGEFGSVYDDFIVPSGPGWSVTSVFSDNLINTNVTGATWEIRQGVAEGTGGTLIASGMTMTPLVTPTGRSGMGFTEYMVEVTGLNVSLPAGAYWLNVTPIGDLEGRSFDSNTSGANCVGTPCGNDMHAFFNSNFFGANWQSTSEQGQPTDFSMGVNGCTGSPTPTPSPTVPPRTTPTPRPRPTPPPRP